MPVTCTNYKLKCGGCPLLALPYREQLAKKQPVKSPVKPSAKHKETER